MKPKLSDHYTFKKIIRMTVSPILMMIFTSLYTIVDGLFVSNFTSSESFSGLNLIWPIIMIVGGVGFMFGTGGTALVSKLLGEKKDKEANRVFSLVIYAVFGVGIVISIGGFFLVRPLAEALGRISEEPSAKMVEEATKYGRVLMLGQSLYMLQNVFQSFFVCAERPEQGFIFTLAAGLTNMLLDYLLIAVAGLGIVGAALATIAGYAVGSIGPVIYFICNKKLNINLGSTSFMIKPLLKSMSNGISEFVSNISNSVVSLVFNIQLLRFYGPVGVSAYGMVAYVNFIFIAIFIGYIIGMAPVVGYHYGAQNKQELRSILKKSMIILAITGVVMMFLEVLCAEPISYAFAAKDEALRALGQKAMRIQSLMMLFAGVNIFLSGFFTALNNGLISGIISLVRTLGFQIVMVLILPLWFGGEGIFWSGDVAEIAALILSVSLLFAFAKRYGYMRFKRDEPQSNV